MCPSHLFLRHTPWCICPSLLRWRKSDCTKPYRSDRQVSQCEAPYWENGSGCDWVHETERESADSQWKQGTVTQGQKWRGGNFRIIAYARGCFYICFPSSRDSPHLKKQSLFRFLSHLGSVDKQKKILVLYCWIVQLETVKMPLAQLADPWRKMALESATSEVSYTLRICYFVASSLTLIRRASAVAQIYSSRSVK